MCDLIFKILLLGDSCVGKTAMLLRYFDDYYKPNTHYYTMGIDFRFKLIDVKEKIIRLEVWDTEGGERCRTILKHYYEIADGIILIYDVTDLNTFKDIRKWMNDIKEKTSPNTPIILVGNKFDSENRAVSEKEGKKLAEELSISFFETSVKYNANIDEVFNFMVNAILNAHKGKTIEDIEKEKNKEVKPKKAKCQIF